jgi:lipid-A-disaccharide synthase
VGEWCCHDGVILWGLSHANKRPKHHDQKVVKLLFVERTDGSQCAVDILLDVCKDVFFLSVQVKHPMATSKPYLLIVAGEPSGDAIAASLVQDVKQVDTTRHFKGVAGPKMRAAGVQSIFPSERLACLGIVEVLRHIAVVWRVYRQIKHALQAEPPEALILVDFAGLNLKLARYAKSRNIPVFYYVPPKVWAWKKYRIKTMQSCVDFVASVLPFEQGIYQKAGIPTAYVGHPLVQAIRAPDPVTPPIQTVEQVKRIVLLPGSRQREVSTTLPVMLQVVERLRQQRPTIECILLQSSSLPDSVFDQHLQAASVHIQRWRNQSVRDLPVVDLALAASGTVTLELGMLGIPTLVMYRLSWLSFTLFRLVSSLRYASLVNLILNESVFPEFLQDKMTAQAIFLAAEQLLSDEQRRAVIVSRLSELASIMEGHHQSCASALMSFLDHNNGLTQQQHSVHQA